MRLPKKKICYDYGGAIGYAGIAPDAINDYQDTQNKEYGSIREAGKTKLAFGTFGAILGGVFAGPEGANLGYKAGSGTAGLITRKSVEEERRVLAEIEAGNAVKDQAQLNYLVNRTSTQKGLGYFKKGGNLKPEYEVEKGEVIQGQDTQVESGTQVASDMTLVGGQTHENGGTDGAGGEFVFSDSIKLNKDVVGMYKKYGIRKSFTYANAAEKFGKIKGKFEQKLDGSPREVRTAQLMIGKLDNQIESLAQMQEATKMENDMKLMYKKGGYLRTYDSGGKLSNKERQQILVDSGYNIGGVDGIWGPKSQTAWEEYEKSRGFSSQNPTPGFEFMTKNPGYTFDPETESTEFKNYARGNTGVNSHTYSGNSDSGNSDKERHGLSPADKADLMNLGVLIGNMSSISNIKKYDKPLLSQFNSTRFVRDRRGVNDIRNLYSTLVRSRNVNPALASTLMASLTRSLGDENARQTIMENEVRNSNNLRLTENQRYNNTLNNDYKRSLIDVDNQKTIDRVNARNAFYRGYAGNQAYRQQEDLERDMLLTRIAADPNDVSSAYMERIKKLPISSSYRRLTRGI